MRHKLDITLSYLLCPTAKVPFPDHSIRDTVYVVSHSEHKAWKFPQLLNPSRACLCGAIQEGVLTADFVKGISFRHLLFLSSKTILTKAKSCLLVTKANFHSSSYLMFPWQINTGENICPLGIIIIPFAFHA